MKTRLLCLAGLVLTVTAGTAQAGFLHFDDKASNTELNAYGGFVWDTGFRAYSDGDYAAYSNSYTAPTASNAVFNAFGASGLATTSGNFDFNGAYFSSWTANDQLQGYSSTTITLEGWNNNVLVATQTMALGAGYVWFAASSSFSNIDTLVFKNDTGVDGRWWLMDNFTFNESREVPEPASLAMWGFGALGLVFARRRRNRRNSAIDV